MLCATFLTSGDERAPLRPHLFVRRFAAACEGGPDAADYTWPESRLGGHAQLLTLPSEAEHDAATGIVLRIISGAEDVRVIVEVNILNPRAGPLPSAPGSVRLKIGPEDGNFTAVNKAWLACTTA